MDKLSDSQRENIKKMSSERLYSKLVQAGVEEEKVENMDRAARMSAWATLVASGKDKPSATEVTKVGAPAGYDVEIEKQRLEFEIKKFEMERHDRQAEMEIRKMEAENQAKKIEIEKEDRQAELEIRKLEAETQAKNAETQAKKIEIEKEDRQAELELRKMEAETKRTKMELEEKLKREEIGLRKEEIRRTKMRDEKEEERRSSMVHMAKMFGDALKNTVARMPNDPVDLVSYFASVESQFNILEVPANLKAQLLRPYLNDKARQLLNRMDPARASDYNAIKKMLLHEFKLTPATYLEKFNTIKKQPEETYILYSARLKSLLDYYLVSREVGKDFDKLVSLLVCDRLKSTLPDRCLRHILSLEASSPGAWLTLEQLTDAIDSYDANHWQDDTPRVAAIGQSRSVKDGVLGKGFQHGSSPPRRVAYVTQSDITNNSESTGSGFNMKKCYVCNSATHLANFHRANKQRFFSNDVHVNATRISEVVPNPHLEGSTVNVGKISDVMNSESAGGVMEEPSDIEQTDIKVYRTSISDVSIESRNDRNVDTIGFARLHYIDVCVSGDNEVTRQVRALCDSGAGISVIRPDLVKIMNTTRVGSVRLRGIVGSPVHADLVKLRVQVKHGCDNFVLVLCAVCEGVNDDLILTNDVVDRLMKSDKYCIEGTCNSAVDHDIKVDKNNATGHNNIKAGIRVGGSAVTNTFTDQVNQGRPQVSPVDTETISRETFKNGIHNLHWTPANRGHWRSNGISQTGDNTFPHSCLPNRNKFVAWHMLHDSGRSILTSEDAKLPTSVFLSGQSNLASNRKNSYRVDVDNQKLARNTHIDRATIVPAPTSRKFNGHVKYKTK